MAKVSLTPSLRKEYEVLFNGCALNAGRMSEIEGCIAGLNANRQRYEDVSRRLGIPWFFVAAIHHLESSQSFTRHLHNGDPLTARTSRVPAGRPAVGQPPFSWEESALDALGLRKLGANTDWSLAGTLYQLEGYNGWGYRLHHPHVFSPYLWSFSCHYTSGKYIADGTWSETAGSKQCGAAVLLRRMAEKGQIAFADQLAPEEDAGPLVVPCSANKSPDPAVVAAAENLQRWLNTFPGIFVKVDGVPGEKTSKAYKVVTGGYLPGDARG